MGVAMWETDVDVIAQQQCDKIKYREKFNARQSIFLYLIITEGNVLMNTLNIHQKQTRRRLKNECKLISYTRKAERLRKCSVFADVLLAPIKQGEKNCCLVTTLKNNGLKLCRNVEDSLQTHQNESFLFDTVHPQHQKLLKLEKLYRECHMLNN